MSRTYLQVTYRKGRPLAAYLTLPRRDGDRSAWVSTVAPGVMVDYAADGRPIGVELLDPSGVSLADLNRLLSTAAAPNPLTAADLAPLAAA
jgi:hypothetical protein